jgi:vacuolar-type H+-ATPase subunit E/Vma4
MSLEAIREKIIRDAENEAEAIIAEARQEKKTALEEMRASLTTRAEKDKARLAESLRERKSRMRKHVLREEEKRLLNLRRRLIDEAVDQAVQDLASDEGYMDLVAALLSQCDFTGDVKVTICEADRDRITQGFLDRQSTEGIRFILSEERHDASGGVILRSGKVSRNATLEMMASIVHDDLVMELSGMLPVEKLESS